jgi:uroporphyrinogen decarboxylase
MNGLERILAAVRFQPADRTPFAPQLFGHAATAGDIDLDAYLRDGRLLAECQLREKARYGSDAVFAFMDFGVETEALGSRLKYYAHQYPDVIDYVSSPTDDPATLRPPDPARDGRMPELLKAVGLLRDALGDSAFVAGTVTGPMTLATQIYGTEAALFLAADDPRRYAAALDFAATVALRFGIAQLAAGAHGIVVFDPAASPAVVPASFFREWVKPHLTHLMGEWHAAGAQATWLNIAGPTADILPDYAEIGADIATFDYYLESAEARRLLPRTCLAGNLKSLDFLGPAPVAPAALAAQARALAADFARQGGYILSSGCEIPPEANAANIAAVAEAAGAR